MKSRKARWILALAGVVVVLGAGAPPLRAEPVQLSPIDCLGPAPDAEPGTPEWTLRDRQNLYCA